MRGVVRRRGGRAAGGCTCCEPRGLDAPSTRCMESVGRWAPTRPSGGRCRWAGRERIRAIGSAGRSIVPCRVRGASTPAGRAPSRASMSARSGRTPAAPARRGGPRAGRRAAREEADRAAHREAGSRPEGRARPPVELRLRPRAPPAASAPARRALRGRRRPRLLGRGAPPRGRRLRRERLLLVVLGRGAALPPRPPRLDQPVERAAALGAARRRLRRRGGGGRGAGAGAAAGARDRLVVAARDGRRGRGRRELSGWCGSRAPGRRRRPPRPRDARASAPSRRRRWWEAGAASAPSRRRRGRRPSSSAQFFSDRQTLRRTLRSRRRASEIQIAHGTTCDMASHVACSRRAPPAPPRTLDVRASAS